MNMKMEQKMMSKIHKAFAGKTAVTLSEAKEMIEEIVNVPVKESAVEEYLRSKKIHVLEEAENDERDLSIDEILHLRDKRNETIAYRNNTELIREYQHMWDQELFQKLLRQNRRLVYKVAFQYQGYLGHKLDFDDLVSEGMLGLAKAILRFDPTLGYQFSTYAYWWIRQKIVRAIVDTGFTVRVPLHLVERIIKIVKLEQRQMHRDSRIDPEAICRELNITHEQYLEAKRVEQQFLKTASLNAVISEEDDDTQLLDFITNDHLKIMGYHGIEYTDPAWMVERILIKEWIWKILGQMKPKEREVIIWRFGLLDDQSRTLEEVGEKFGVTRERIRQIEKRALDKLRKRLKREKFFVS